MIKSSCGLRPGACGLRPAVWRSILLAVVLCAAPAQGQSAPPPGCVDGVLPSGALSRLCVPPVWNELLIVFAPGNAFDLPGSVPIFRDTLPDGTSLAGLVQSLGFAYATTSYRRNGLAVLEGVEDVVELVNAFRQQMGVPARTYMAGASVGGLVATLLAERAPHLFAGAYAGCGPIGSFEVELQYLFDFRVLFDYFFPGVFPRSAVDTNDVDLGLWLNGYYPETITARLLASPHSAVELMKTSRAAYDPADFDTVISTTLRVLEFNVLGSMDSRRTLGGNPTDNRSRWYFGSSNDLLLNLSVRRYAADLPAVQALLPYNTSGDLRIPVVSLHTTGDEVAPFLHEVLYLLKARPSGRGSFIPLPVFRYGHCNFRREEVVAGLLLLLLLP